jgi:hypothetical protein
MEMAWLRQSCVKVPTLVLPSYSYHTIEMLHCPSSQPRDTFFHFGRHIPRPTMRVDQHGDEGLRHTRARPAPIDPQRLNALPPDCVCKRWRDVDDVHEGGELAPVLWEL